MNTKNVFKFIFILGLVSLLGDIVYESARSVIGPFLSLLGANAIIIGAVSGLGEFLGYTLRLVSGFITDRTRRYWQMVFIGYGLLLSIPLLALVGSWQVASFLILLERIGKAVRTPARDVLISQATVKVGRGIGFGIHEALDQIGAIIGPFLFFLVFSIKYKYQTAFAFLFLPALLLIASLTLAKTMYPSPMVLEKKVYENGARLSKVFWIYSIFSFFTIAGFVNFQIISYHFKIQNVISDTIIPIFYTLAMAIDAIIALIIGKVYDKIGLSCLFILPILNIFIPILTFSSSLHFVLIGIIIWGSVMGMQETIMRAAVADLAPLSRRGTAYGIFNTIYGLAWFLGGTLIGTLYEISVNYIILVVAFFQIISLIFWWQFKQ